VTQRTGNFDDFGMATVTMAGALDAKLRAIAEAGFSQVMLDAVDVAGHPGGVQAAARALRDSGLRPTGLQWLRDFEGLSGASHAYKLGIAKALLQMARDLGAPMLLAASSTLGEASGDLRAIARDLRKLAMLAIPLELKIAYEGISEGSRIRDCLSAWDAVSQADMPNLGIAVDSAHTVLKQVPLDDLELIEPHKLFVVRLADVLPVDAPGAGAAAGPTRWLRVFPGEGRYTDQTAALVLRLAALGFGGDYSFEVVNDDYRQMPLSFVAQRARAASEWLGEDVLRRSVPLPGQMRLRAAARR
jgi:sugar phosphate isomerase/epimerase